MRQASLGFSQASQESFLLEPPSPRSPRIQKRTPRSTLGESASEGNISHPGFLEESQHIDYSEHHGGNYGLPEVSQYLRIRTDSNTERHEKRCTHWVFWGMDSESWKFKKAVGHVVWQHRTHYHAWQCEVIQLALSCIGVVPSLDAKWSSIRHADNMSSPTHRTWVMSTTSFGICSWISMALKVCLVVKCRFAFMSFVMNHQPSVLQTMSALYF